MGVKVQDTLKLSVEPAIKSGIFELVKLPCTLRWGRLLGVRLVSIKLSCEIDRVVVPIPTTSNLILKRVTLSALGGDVRAWDSSAVPRELSMRCDARNELAPEKGRPDSSNSTAFRIFGSQETVISKPLTTEVPPST